MITLFAWYNFVFAAPFGLALLYMFLLMAGLSPGGGEADIDIDHDIDVSHDLDHDLTAEHSVEGLHDTGSLARFLSFFGIGKLPFSLILVSFCFIWGFVGMWGNAFFGTFLPHPILYFWPSLATTILMSGVGTSALAKLLYRLMPSSESYATYPRELLGKSAEVIFDITETSGKARLRDNYGNLLDVPCRVAGGMDLISEGDHVLLTTYDPAEKFYFVRRHPLREVATSR